MLVEYKLYLEKWIEKYGEKIDKYPYFNVHPVVFSDIGDGDADAYMADIKRRASNITFLDKSVLYVIDKSDAIFNATTPTVLFLTLDDIDPGLNELLESFIWNGQRVSEHLSIVVVGNAQDITDFSFVSRVAYQCNVYELLAKANGCKTKGTADLQKGAWLGGDGGDDSMVEETQESNQLTELSKTFNELPVFISDDLLKEKDKYSLYYIISQPGIVRGDENVFVDDEIELSKAIKMGFVNVFRCMSMLNGPLDGAKHWVEGVPFDIYKSSELFDLDELHKKIADFNNAAETVVYLPSDASAKVLCNFYIDGNNRSFMFNPANGEWMQLKAICFGRSPIKSDALHEEVDDNKVLGIDIEFLKQQFFMHIHRV